MTLSLTSYNVRLYEDAGDFYRDESVTIELSMARYKHTDIHIVISLSDSVWRVTLFTLIGVCSVILIYEIYYMDRCCRLENALMGMEILPATFFSQTIHLETLNLNNNKLTQLQPLLLGE